MGRTTRGRSRISRAGAPAIVIVLAAIGMVGIGGHAAAATGPGPDLRVAAIAGGDVAPGVPFERSVTVTNAGSDAAHGVHVLAWLPVGVRISTVLPVFAGGTCTVISLGGRGSATLFVDCRRDALAPGASATLRMPLVATVDVSCGALVTRVEALADDEPAASVDARNRATIADRIPCAAEPGPDLRVRASARARQPAPGGARVTYRVEVANVGTEGAREVGFTAALPRGLRPVGRPSGPSTRCTITSSVGSGREESRWSAGCVLEHLAADDTAVFDVRARVLRDPPCVDSRMLATVRSPDEPRSSRRDNADTATVALACHPRIELRVTAPGAAHPGDRVPVTVHARNVSGATIEDVRARIGGCQGLGRIDAGDGDRVLAPRERWTFRCTRGVGGASDPATVPVVVLARDSAHQVTVARVVRRIDVWRPQISIAVTSASPEAPIGSRTTLQARVENTGDAPLRDVVIDVPSVGGSASLSRLGAGEARTVSLEITLPRRLGALGEARVTATDPLGAEAGDTDTVPLIVTSAFTDGDSDDSDGAGRDADPGGGTSAFTGPPALGRAALAIAVLVTAGVGSLVAARRRRSRG